MTTNLYFIDMFLIAKIKTYTMKSFWAVLLKCYNIDYIFYECKLVIRIRPEAKWSYYDQVLILYNDRTGECCKILWWIVVRGEMLI